MDVNRNPKKEPDVSTPKGWLGQVLLADEDPQDLSGCLITSSKTSLFFRSGFISENGS